MLPHHLVTLTCTGLASPTFQAVLSAASWSCVLAHFLFLFQDNVLNIINQIMDVCIPQDRAPRDFCVKFPEEIRHDNLAGQLWFGAEVVGGRRGLGSRCWVLSSCFSAMLTCVHLQVQGPASPPPRVTDGAEPVGWRGGENMLPGNYTQANIDTRPHM